MGKRERALERALKALLTDATALAKNSYSEWHGDRWLWNDTVWRRGDPDHFDLIVAARKALSMPPDARPGR